MLPVATTATKGADKPVIDGKAPDVASALKVLFLWIQDVHNLVYGSVHGTREGWTHTLPIHTTNVVF